MIYRYVCNTSGGEHLFLYHTIFEDPYFAAACHTTSGNVLLCCICSTVQFFPESCQASLVQLKNAQVSARSFAHTDSSPTALSFFYAGSLLSLQCCTRLALTPSLLLNCKWCNEHPHINNKLRSQAVDVPSWSLSIKKLDILLFAFRCGLA